MLLSPDTVAVPAGRRAVPRRASRGRSHTVRPRTIAIPLLAAAPLAELDLRLAVLTCLCFAAAGWLQRSQPAAIATLPLARYALPGVQVLVAAVVAFTVGRIGLGLAAPAELILLSTGIALAARLAASGWEARQLAVRVLVLGTAAEARELRHTVQEVGARGYRVVATTDSLTTLDAVGDAAAVDLIVFTDHVARPAVLGHVAAAMRTRDLRAMHLDRFCETALGVVPLDSVGSAWIAELADPSRNARESRLPRMLDVTVSLILLLPCLLLLAVLAPLILADGGRTVFFRQDRVGRGGHPFRILKLRTMRGTGADWSGPNDPRVTRLGRLLRKTHIDELPQLLNVLRGEMALVGPRPEQVAIARQLEREIPLFPYRQLVRPGITGWARVRCGYARTTEESALKLGNDLFYIRHRSLTLDIAVLLETLRLTVFEKQFEVRAPAARYVLGRRRTTGDSHLTIDVAPPRPTTTPSPTAP